MTEFASPRPRVRLSDLPELATRIGMHGTSRHAEVGGAVCFDIIITLIVAGEGGEP